MANLNEVHQAKTILARWLDKRGFQSQDRSDILRGFDRVRDELPRRDTWFEVMSTSLDEAGGITTELIAPLMQVSNCRGGLVVATITPGWGFGWHSVLGNKITYDVLSWLLHYMRQYVHRSLVVAILATLWDDCQILAHPFGSSGSFQRYGPIVEPPPYDVALSLAVQKAQTTWYIHGSTSASQASTPVDTEEKPTLQEVSLSRNWIDRNTLDPFIHGSIFQHLRAQALIRDGYGMEAMNAFDCVLGIARQFLHERGVVNQKPTRSAAMKILGLDKKTCETAELLGFIRNQFGAHAGQWRWWDYYEMFESDIEEIALTSGVVLSALADYEPRVRSVQPMPDLWSEWFWNNFEILWDAVWYERIDTWYAKYSGGI